MDQPIEQDESTALIAQARAVVKIVDTEQYKYLVETRRRMKLAKKYFTDLYTPRINDAKLVVKNLQNDLGKFVDPIDDALEYSGPLLSDFDDLQKRLKEQREREQRIADAKAIEAAEAEKKQLADLADELGQKTLAEEIRDTPIEEPPPMVIMKGTPPAKETGVSFREDFKFRIVDESVIPREYLMVDAVKIGKVVRALKTMAKITGIQVYSEKIPIQRV